MPAGRASRGHRFTFIITAWICLGLEISCRSLLITILLPTGFRRCRAVCDGLPALYVDDGEPFPSSRQGASMLYHRSVEETNGAWNGLACNDRGYRSFSMLRVILCRVVVPNRSVSSLAVPVQEFGAFCVLSLLYHKPKSLLVLSLVNGVTAIDGGVPGFL